LWATLDCPIQRLVVIFFAFHGCRLMYIIGVSSNGSGLQLRLIKHVHLWTVPSI
jgi:hypothetical protein